MAEPCHEVPIGRNFAYVMYEIDVSEGFVSIIPTQIEYQLFTEFDEITNKHLWQTFAVCLSGSFNNYCIESIIITSHGRIKLPHESIADISDSYFTLKKIHCEQNTYLFPKMQIDIPKRRLLQLPVIEHIYIDNICQSHKQNDNIHCRRLLREVEYWLGIIIGEV